MSKQIIAAGTKVKLKSTAGGRLNGFHAGEIVEVRENNKLITDTHPIVVARVARDDHNGYTTIDNLEMIAQDAPAVGAVDAVVLDKEIEVGDIVRVVELVSDAFRRVKVGDILEVSMAGDSIRTKEHGGWNFNRDCFEVIGGPNAAEIAKITEALKDLRRKDREALIPVKEYSRATDGMVGKIVRTELGRLGFLHQVDSDGEAHMCEIDSGSRFSGYPDSAEGRVRLATKKEVMAEIEKLYK